MTFQFDQFSAAIRAGGAIDAQDTLALRQWAWADGTMGQAEAEALFELNALSRSRDLQWIDFFVEAVCDYVINGSDPKGYVSEQDAAWLIAQIDKDGRVDSLGEMELLVKLAEKITDAPNVLKFFALDQLERIVVSGEGPTRESADSPRCVTAAEAVLLRRLVFAPGSNGPARVSREEADALFRIKDVCLHGQNAPEWKKLFVQGVANHLTGFSSYTPLTSERAAQLENFMRVSTPSIGRFFGRMAQLDLDAGLKAIFGGSENKRDLDTEQALAEAVTGEEQSWLNVRMADSLGIDSYERALLTFVAKDAR